jgi:hypothetical protein
MSPVPDDNLQVRASLRNAPKIAEQIGHMNAAWAAVEFRIFALFCLLSDTPIPIARAAFYSQMSTGGRIAILKAVAEVVLRKRRGEGTNSDFKRLNRLLGAIGEISGERNKYVHDPWAGHAEASPRTFQLRLNKKGVHGQYQYVSQSAVARLTERIETKRGALYRLYHRLAPKIPALHEKLVELRSLSLAFASPDPRPKRKKAKRAHQPRS